MSLASQSANYVFKAVADPTRRRMLDLLAVSPLSVRELTAEFSISQPGISQHLQELRKAGLVAAKRVHRENHYSLKAAPIAAVYAWAKRYRVFFDPAGHAWSFIAGVGGGAGNSGKKKKRGERKGQRGINGN